MKSLKSSLLHKIVLGYKISSGRKFSNVRGENLRIKPQFTKGSIRKMGPSNMEEMSKALNLSPSAVEKVYGGIKEIEANLHEPTRVDIENLKAKIKDLESGARDSGAYLVPQIISSISGAKEKVHDLELDATPEVDPIAEVKRQVEELERDKTVLEEAKKTIMEKYYNREIDEGSIKNIMDNYEQRLVETEIRIKNWATELEKLEKEPKLLPKDQKEKKEMIRTIREATNQAVIRQSPGTATVFPQVPQLTFKLSPIKSAVGASPQNIEADATFGMSAQKSQQPVVQQVIREIIQQPSLQQATREIGKTKKVSGSEGFEIPQIPKTAIKIGSLETEEEMYPILLTYPLIPRKPAKNEPIFAYVKIFWDTNDNRYMYMLAEPQLTEKLKDVYRKVKEMLEQRLDIDFSKLKRIEAKDFLDKQVDDVLKYFNFVLTGDEKRILKYYMGRDFTGLELIEPLLQDPNIEDISCDGVGIPLFVFHRNPEIGSIITNVTFDSAERLDSFIIRLAQLCGKSISVSQPLLDGTLPDGSRIQATLGTDIARRGSNFTIRKFTEEPLTPIHLLNYGTLDASILAYLWFVVDYGRSVLVSGGTASGKTSLLNVLSLFIRPEKKIVSIEDTAELRLPHPHWVPVVARTAIGAEGKGEVDMFELLRESLRQRPDYIVVGEVRGKEAYILFQQMATGHPSLATIHAENISRLIDRLTTPPISLPAGLINTLDMVVFLARMKYKNKFIRKVTEIVEIIDFDSDSNVPITNQVFKWNPQNDKFEVTSKSISLKRIADLTGISEKDIKDEIQRRMVVLEWMKVSKILDYRDVHRVFSIYYTDPERLLSYIQGAG